MEINLEINCDNCNEEIILPIMDYSHNEIPTVNVSAFSQTTWTCKCGTVNSIGDIDIRDVKDL